MSSRWGFWLGMVKYVETKSMQWLQEVLRALKLMEHEKNTRGLGMGYGKLSVAMGKHGAAAKQVSRALGIRARGAGRKNWLLPLW